MAKILVVDDEPSMLKVLQLNLDMEGHKALLAADGGTALARIEAEKPDLVLLDVMMPVLDGWQVLEQISKMDGDRPRVIVMTAKSGGSDLVKGMEFGADEYVTKPFEIDELMEVVTAVLSRSEQENEARRSELRRSALE